mgnify:CR=1 FL=1
MEAKLSIKASTVKNNADSKKAKAPVMQRASKYVPWTFYCGD